MLFIDKMINRTPDVDQFLMGPAKRNVNFSNILAIYLKYVIRVYLWTYNQFLIRALIN